MPDSPRRPRAAGVLLAFVALTLISGAVGLAPVTAPPASAAEPEGIDRFLWALGKVESGGRYTARNATTGAYGKYQILPSNWGAWARRYIGNPKAKPTPRNQEIVARGRVLDLYRSLSDWGLVAHWWLTGRTAPPARWTSTASGYVKRVMRLFDDGGGAAVPASNPEVRYQETSSTIGYDGKWRIARHAGYSHGKVRYAESAGATASFTFRGTSVTWYGPVGPTRGQARVYLDGELVKTVDLRRPSFRASLAVFRYRWAESGRHTLLIEVVGTRGRSMVAVDSIVVGR